ncbi:hypothetical protein PUN28_016476 [Cardiocondyla obscurior]|uniref:Uncharacterized protein n=1 Tax=Cardiocondyla obscurior TaxID=286306 RepID=A0AAW2EPJ9_9HYME
MLARGRQEERRADEEERNAGNYLFGKERFARKAPIPEGEKEKDRRSRSRVVPAIAVARSVSRSELLLSRNVPRNIARRCQTCFRFGGKSPRGTVKKKKKIRRDDRVGDRCDAIPCTGADD